MNVYQRQLKQRLAARKWHDKEDFRRRAEERARYEAQYPWFCGVRWNLEELDEVKRALEGAPVNPGDEITTMRFKEYKADIHGKLFRVPDGSLGRECVGVE